MWSAALYRRSFGSIWSAALYRRFPFGAYEIN
jgi:hypothetical protein